MGNPGTKQSQAVLTAVVELVGAVNATELRRSVGQLVVGAFFFVMRACKFSDVGAPRRTRILTLGDIEFRREGRRIESDDEDEMAAADTVSLTFRTQKNGEKGTTVTQQRTTGTTMGSAKICPVASFARLVTRVRRYESDEPEWKDRRHRPINLVASTGRFSLVTSNQVLHHLQAAALQYGGEGRLVGFPVSKIGTHSLRAGAAMAMFLAGVPAETIQLIGRRRSQKFRVTSAGSRCSC